VGMLLCLSHDKLGVSDNRFRYFDNAGVPVLVLLWEEAMSTVTLALLEVLVVWGEPWK
jgi:hypothetical protein